MNPPADHLDRIMAVMAAAFDPAFGEAWTRRQVEDALVIGNCYYLLIGPDGSFAGEGPAAGFSLSRAGSGEEELLLFAVAPDHRRRGLGAAMLKGVAAEARRRGAARLLLEMRCGNPAESLYRAFGFAPIGRRPAYYRQAQGGRIDAITFACDISRDLDR